MIGAHALLLWAQIELCSDIRWRVDLKEEKIPFTQTDKKFPSRIVFYWLPRCMSEESTAPGFIGKGINKTQNAQQTASSAVTTSQSFVHALASLQPTMAEVAAVVFALELLHAVIEALHTAKTNVRAGQLPLPKPYTPITAARVDATR